MSYFIIDLDLWVPLDVNGLTLYMYTMYELILQYSLYERSCLTKRSTSLAWFKRARLYLNLN